MQIQEAYDNLSDPAKRREFDSIDEFDDTLPESCAPADFYKVLFEGKKLFSALVRCRQWLLTPWNQPTRWRQQHSMF